MVHPGYRKRTIFLLVALLIVRFWFGQTFELTGQEAYLWLQGHGSNLSPAYWERGPFVPFLIRIGTDFFGDTELGVRWPAAVVCCLSGFILFYLARHWFNARAAFWTVVLFIVVPMYAWKFSFMTESSACIGLMAIAILAYSLAKENNRGCWWLLGGAACGMALLVALSNAWWIVGVAIYFVSHPDRRHRFREGWILGSFALAGLFLAPLMWWWCGPQVADVAHTRILNAWPLSHGFSLNQGFHFVALEVFYLCPLIFLFLFGILWKLNEQLWRDPRFSLLVCMAVPGLAWQNLSAFFHEGHFELIPALFLPLLLLAGCYMAGVTAANRRLAWASGIALLVAALQSLAGLNPFYLAPKVGGNGYVLRHSRSGVGMSGFAAANRQISWRNLADAVQGMQRDLGATLVITDTPETASALSFYLPRNPFVYVESKSKAITHFEFWPGYAQSASPNDSAIYINHSTNPTTDADPPSAELIRDFASVTKIDDPPLPGFDKSWDIWNCQNFIGLGGQPTGEAATTPMHESDSLPAK